MVNDTRAEYDHLQTLSDEALCALVKQGSRDAEEILVGRYHRLVRSCARPYFLAGGDSEDLLQEGMFGLIKAIREYEPGHEASLCTFAVTCIRRRLYSVLRAAASGKHSPLNKPFLWIPLSLTRISPCPRRSRGLGHRLRKNCRSAGKRAQAAVRIRGKDFRVLSGRSHLP